MFFKVVLIVVKNRYKIRKIFVTWKSLKKQSLMLEPVGTAGIGEDSDQVALMLLYVEKSRCSVGIPSFPASSVKFVQTS